MGHYSFLTESTETFSLDKFKSFTTINDRIKYCNQTLKFLGHGIGKKVYKLDNDKVLKVGYNKGGYGQNECEIKLGKYKFPFLCNVYDHDDRKFTWLISELCYITMDTFGLENFKTKIKNVTGCDPEIIFFLGYTCIVGGIDLYKKIRNDLIKVCDKIVEIRNTSKYIDMKNKQVGIEACKMVDIPESSRKIIIDRFYGTIFSIARHCKKFGHADTKMLFNIIDTGKYKRINFINDMVKIKNLNEIVFMDDCFNYSNTGIVKRNGKDYFVILDYGWSREMDKNWRKK